MSPICQQLWFQVKELQRQLRRVPAPGEVEDMVRDELRELEQELRRAAASALAKAVRGGEQPGSAYLGGARARNWPAWTC